MKKPPDNHSNGVVEVSVPARPASSLLTLAPLAVAWGDFLLGVAVTVVGGLVLAVVLGGGRSLLTRNERKQQEQAQAYERRAPIRAGFAALAAELRWNADIAERCEQQQGHVPSEAAQLRVQAWEAHRAEMMPLRDADPKLWWQLERMYDALSLSKERGGYPPNSGDIRRLIEEVDLRAD